MTATYSHEGIKRTLLDGVQCSNLGSRAGDRRMYALSRQWVPDMPNCSARRKSKNGVIDGRWRNRAGAITLALSMMVATNH